MTLEQLSQIGADLAAGFYQRNVEMDVAFRAGKLADWRKKERERLAQYARGTIAEFERTHGTGDPD